MFLVNEGFHVSKTTDGASGIKHAIQEIPDLIICPVDTDEFCAFEIMYTLRKIDNTKHIAFLILIEQYSKEMFHRVFLADFDGFLMQDFSYNDLLYSVRRILNKYDELCDKNKKEYYALFNNPLTGIVVLNGYLIQKCNDLFVSMLGGSLDTYFNKPIFNCVVVEDIESFKRTIDLCLKKVFVTFHESYRFISDKKISMRCSVYGSVISEKRHSKIICSILFNAKSPIASDTLSAFSSLTKREAEILQLICHGYSNDQIASMLSLSTRTVQGHRAHIMEKANAKNSADLVRFAIQNNYFSL